MARLNTSISEGKDKYLPTFDEVLAQCPLKPKSHPTIDSLDESPSQPTPPPPTPVPKTPSSRRMRYVVIDSDDESEDNDEDAKTSSQPPRNRRRESSEFDEEEGSQSPTESDSGSELARGKKRIDDGEDFEYEISGDEAPIDDIAWATKDAILHL